MLLNRIALPVPGPCASRMMVPSSTFQSTSASISCSSPPAFSAAIQPRRSPNARGLRCKVIANSPSCRRTAQLARRELDGFDYFRVGGAAAEIAREVVPDLVIVRIGMLGQQLSRHQHEARRAEAA